MRNGKCDKCGRKIEEGRHHRCPPVQHADDGPGLFDLPAPQALPGPLERAWEDFHRDNPRVFTLFERFALDAIARGKRVGAKAIWERLRWEVRMTTDGDDFKLNNNHTAYYAREFIRRHPDHAEFFATRRVG